MLKTEPCITLSPTSVMDPSWKCSAEASDLKFALERRNTTGDAAEAGESQVWPLRTRKAISWGARACEGDDQTNGRK
jgi:hypothetical protein